MVLMVGEACVWKALGLVAVMDITGRLFHKGVVAGEEGVIVCHWCFVAM